MTPHSSMICYLVHTIFYRAGMFRHLSQKTTITVQGALIFNFYHMDKNFKKGLVIGGLIGGTLIALAQTKKGRELRLRAMRSAEEIFGELQREVGEIAAVSMEKFNELAERAAEEYIKKKNMALEMKDTIKERLQEKWHEMQREELFREIRRQFSELPDKTEDAYRELVSRLTEEYAEKKEFGLAAKNKLLREFTKRWEEVKESF